MKNSVIDIGKDQKFNPVVVKPTKTKWGDQCRMQQLGMLDIPDCSICCEQMHKDLATLVPCGHVFHQKCIKSYSKLECPICRKQNTSLVALHFSIEQKQNKKSKEIQQNKLFQIEQNDQQNKEKVIINKLWHLVCKGKQQFDNPNSINILSNSNNYQFEKQRFKSFESLLQDITKIVNDYNNQIDLSKSTLNKNNVNLPQLQLPKIVKPIYMDEKANKTQKYVSLITKQNNILDISDQNYYNQRYPNRLWGQEKKYAFQKQIQNP